MGKLLQDVQLSLRGLRSRPGFALVAVSTIALGIAAAGAIWSVVDAVLMRPLPFSEPERLVFVWETMPSRGVERNVVGPANLMRWRDRARSFSGLAGFIRFDTNLDGGGGTRSASRAGFTTGNLFTILGVRPCSAARSSSPTRSPARRTWSCSPKATGAGASAAIPRRSAARSG
jgi:hypothetical protein